jgi:hypothetical protein
MSAIFNILQAHARYDRKKHHFRQELFSDKVKSPKRYKSLAARKKRTDYLKSLHMQGKSECSKCGKIKDIDRFYKSNRGIGKLPVSSRCRYCIKRKDSERVKKIELLKELRSKGLSLCGKCKETKALNEFYLRENGDDIKCTSWCRKCYKKKD